MARDFGGVSGVDFLSTTALVIPSYPATMACWALMNTAGNGPGLQNQSSSTLPNNHNSTFLLLTGEARLLVRGTATTVITTVNTQTTAGVWFHVCCRIDAAGSIVMLNGDLANAGTVVGAVADPSGFDQAILGGIETGGGAPLAPLDGLMAWPTVWNVGLTDDELVLLANKVHPYAMRPGNVISCPPLLGRNNPELDLLPGITWTINGTVTADERQPPIPPLELTDYNLTEGRSSGNAWKIPALQRWG